MPVCRFIRPLTPFRINRRLVKYFHGSEMLTANAATVSRFSEILSLNPPQKAIVLPAIVSEQNVPSTLLHAWGLEVKEDS